MKKLLSILSSIGLVGTAGATAVACGNTANKEETPKPKEPNKEKLQSLITKAEGLIKDSKKEEAVEEALKLAIKEAQTILSKENLTEEELTTAETKLETAIKAFEDAKPIPSPKEILENLITKAEGLIKDSKKEAKVTDALKAAVEEAKTVLNNKESTDAQLVAAAVKLEIAIKAFENAGNDSKIKEKLQNLIGEAQNLIENSRKEEAVDTALESIIEESKNILNKENVTETELTEAVTKLEAAIKTFNDAKDDSKPKENLQNLINKAEKLIENSKKEAKVTDALKAAVEEVKEVLKDSTNNQELRVAIIYLESAISDFEKAKDAIVREFTEENVQEAITELEAENKLVFNVPKGVKEIIINDHLVKEFIRVVGVAVKLPQNIHLQWGQLPNDSQFKNGLKGWKPNNPKTTVKVTSNQTSFFVEIHSFVINIG